MHKNISEIDSNFKISTTLGIDDICFYNVRQEPFKLYGLHDYKNGPGFRRMPEDIAKAVNEGVGVLNRNTSGGRVRFKTDSPYVAIKAIMPSAKVMSHMTIAGSCGFDLYINQGGQSRYFKTFMPPANIKDGYESVVYFNDKGMKDLTINFPLYNDVTELYIGVQQSAALLIGDEYKIKTPVVYYGSSITQGGCASRPGNSYPAIISRKLDCDYINLGFSGSARAEDIIAEYISGLKMSVFVYDYDHNAPDVNHLAETHERMFKKIRSKNPDLPVVMVSKPDFNCYFESDIKRRDIIYNTYINAVKSGDGNVYFIDGQSLFKDSDRDSCTVDGCHPNDLGFMRMAEVIGYKLHRILNG